MDSLFLITPQFEINSNTLSLPPLKAWVGTQLLKWDSLKKTA